MITVQGGQANYFCIISLPLLTSHNGYFSTYPLHPWDKSTSQEYFVNFSFSFSIDADGISDSNSECAQFALYTHFAIVYIAKTLRTSFPAKSDHFV